MSKAVSQDELDKELFRAAAGGSTERVVELLAQGANINAVNKHGRTPLQVAIAGSLNLSLIRVLCEAGVNLNATDNLGLTALARLAATAKFTASEQLLEGMEILLLSGADPFIKDSFGNGFLNYLCMEAEGYEHCQNKSQMNEPRCRFSRWFHIALEVFVTGIISGEESVGELLPKRDCPPMERVALLLSAAAVLSDADIPGEAGDKAVAELCESAGGSLFYLRGAMSYILGQELLPPLVTESGFLRVLAKTLSSNPLNFPDESGELNFSPYESRRLLEILASVLDNNEGVVFEFLSPAGGESFKSWLSEASKIEGGHTDRLITKLAGRLGKKIKETDHAGNLEASWSPVIF